MNKKNLSAARIKKGLRYVKNVGLGFKTPKEAVTGTYIDKKCPFTGDVAIRGSVFKGLVISTKMKHTIIIRRNYLHYIIKYNRFEKRHKNVAVHCSPCFSRALCPGVCRSVGYVCIDSRVSPPRECIC